MELEQQLNQILSDPDSMAQIMHLAGSLGLGAGDKPPAAQKQSPASGTDQLLPMIRQFQSTDLDRRQAALFEALKPFLSPERRKKLDKAIQISRLSRLAEFVLKNVDLTKLLESR